MTNRRSFLKSLASLAALPALLSLPKFPMGATAPSADAASIAQTLTIDRHVYQAFSLEDFEEVTLTSTYGWAETRDDHGVWLRGA